jgi:hypothetical protein
MSQLMNLVRKMKAGEVTSEDVIYFEDMFQPGIESLPYIMQQCPANMRPRIAVRCLAQTIDPDDFVHVWGMQEWMGHYEKMVDSFADIVLATNEEMAMHMKMGVDALLQGYSKLAKTPQAAAADADLARKAERRVEKNYRKAIAELLEATVLPGLQDSIVTYKVSTPQDFKDRLWSFKGAGFGLEPLLLQSAWFRPHNRSEDIPGLYMVGAGTHPGAGVPGVLMSARTLEQVLPDVKAFA